MDRKIAVVSLLGLALTVKNVGDACATEINSDPLVYYSNPSNIDIFCQINSFNPEHPEQNSGYQNRVASMDYITASGTVSGTSLSTVENL
ncbi:hypothetical protein HYU91_00730 [Candidatus Collierbacteria bacterium]|nr:hypothetical protein [Candidatus Collierbacteria bacterium]